VRRSEFATAYGEGATLDAEAAGARWEPEPEPAAELPTEVAAKIGDVCYDVATRDVRHHWTDYACAMRAALAPLWPRPQPAGPGRERRLAVPLRLIPSAWPTCRVEDAARRNILDVSTYKPGEINEPDESWTETDRATLVELVNHYNAPPAPAAGWPAPTLAVPGKPATQPVGDHLRHIGGAWRWAHRGERACHWWLPQPPPPPKAP
jgi:hypothetical protein